MSNESLRPAVEAGARVAKLEAPDRPAYSFSFAVERPRRVRRVGLWRAPRPL